MATFLFSLGPSFSKNLSLQVRYLISFQKHKFAVFYNTCNNIVVAKQYLKTMMIFRNLCKQKTFNHTIKLVVEKQLKK